MIRVGPVGWTYADWNRLVYPVPRPRGFDPLRYLAGYFSTLEINSSFYGPLKPETVTSWLERIDSSPSFRFTAKLWRHFTHERPRSWKAGDVNAVRTALEPLRAASRLGALLLQFPWSFRDTKENRAWIRSLAATFDGFPLVVEVRHASWQNAEFFALLEEWNVGFVNVDQPLFHDSIHPSAMAPGPIGYVRVQGRNYGDGWGQSEGDLERYDYLYSAAELKPWADLAVRIASADSDRDVFVVTDNHYRGKAVANALMLDSMIHRRRVDAPEPAVQTYGDILRPYTVGAEPEARAVSSEPDFRQYAVTSAAGRYPARKAGPRSVRGA